MKGEVYKINVDTRVELLAHILEAAAGIKKCKAELVQKKNAIFAQELKMQ
jgi:hypothetical protein